MVIAEGEIVDRFQLKSVIVPVKIRNSDLKEAGIWQGNCFLLLGIESRL